MALFDPQPHLLAPGAVHLPGWLPPPRQKALAKRCQDWADATGGPARVRMPSGNLMSVRQICLGWHWSPYRYRRTTPDGRPVLPFPDWLAELARNCVTDAFGDAGDYAPDVALINHYDTTARMGMHQDKDEASPAPVVSISLGDTAVFRLGNTTHRNRPWRQLHLASGDAFVFGGPSRMAYHGVPKILPATAPPQLEATAGRWNITVRQTGFSKPVF